MWRGGRQFCFPRPLNVGGQNNSVTEFWHHQKAVKNSFVWDTIIPTKVWSVLPSSRQSRLDNGLILTARSEIVWWPSSKQCWAKLQYCVIAAPAPWEISAGGKGVWFLNFHLHPQENSACGQMEWLSSYGNVSMCVINWIGFDTLPRRHSHNTHVVCQPCILTCNFKKLVLKCFLKFAITLMKGRTSNEYSARPNKLVIKCVA